MFINDGELGPVGGEVQAPDGGADLQDVHWKGVVDEDFENLAIF